MSIESVSQFESEIDDQNEEYLVKCIVDTFLRKFILFSNLGDEKIIECETVDQFMNVLSVVRSSIDENNIAEVTYSNPF